MLRASPLQRKLTALLLCRPHHHCHRRQSKLWPKLRYVFRFNLHIRLTAVHRLQSTGQRLRITVHRTPVLFEQYEELGRIERNGTVHMGFRRYGLSRTSSVNTFYHPSTNAAFVVKLWPPYISSTLYHSTLLPYAPVRVLHHSPTQAVARLLSDGKSVHHVWGI